MTSRIAVVSASKAEKSIELFSAFEEFLPVRFLLQDEIGDCSGFNAAILVAPDNQLLHAAVRARLPCLVVPADWRGLDTTATRIRFGAANVLDARLRERTLNHNCIRMWHMLGESAGDIVLAHANDAACWIARRIEGVMVQFTAYPLPRFTRGEGLFDYLNGGNFIQALPLLHFIRDVSGQYAWRPPRPRACVMFDDPNLHWTSYGYLPYRQIARAAEKEGFHVAFATVPLDAWYANRAAAALFATSRRRLSLLIHGNDHTRQELGRLEDVTETKAVLSQALQRTARFERRFGVRVCKVMAPPHGACRPSTLELMSRLGFEGAFISPWSLRDWAGDYSWPSSFGVTTSEVVAANFPVAPRFRLSQDCEPWVVINAFLDRPIVPVGHHHSLRFGLELLMSIAGVINSIPGVQWLDTTAILRSNFYSRIDGETISIQPFSSWVSVAVPDGVSKLQVAPLSGCPSDWICDGAVLRDDPGDDRGWSVTTGCNIQLRHKEWSSIDYKAAKRRSGLWAPLRRAACEVRDRLQPMFSF